MTKKIEMLETRTIRSQQRVRGEILTIPDEISNENANYLIARKEAKPVKAVAPKAEPKPKAKSKKQDGEIQE